ncbi:hypothetical protein Mag101_00300 [Microbulbifer agarilyticus]|uniref:Uncharacterized protein n=1 Tax=Microbulbifer agarilyticus TaxID=260552 RepID=A0A1Q2M0M5_9GAMM|nr:hypothetical protein [Microbulbifer agarilyticus]AQQ66261.1 hypothetical protein Mag101_00300 [Microbulbifer agarilyticus]
MKSRILIHLAVVWGLAGTVIAQDQAPAAVEETASGSAYAAETMEHVEATAYPVPQLIAEEEVSDNKYLIQEQHREQYRQEMLRDPNREALLNNVRSTQQQQVEALMRAAEEQLAQQQAPQEMPTQEELETSAADAATTEQAPAGALTQSVSDSSEGSRETSLTPAVLPEQEADRETPANEIQLEQEQENTSEQEPS